MKFNPYTEVVQIGGADIIISALPAGPMIYGVLPLTQQLAKGDMEVSEQLAKIAPFIVQSLSYANPMTVEELLDAASFADILEIFFAVIRISGAKKGEAMTAENQTGPASSAVL